MLACAALSVLARSPGESSRTVTTPLLLEHVNLNIPDADLARAFYITGLSGAVNPETTNWRQLHVNAGASQFHLPFKSSLKGFDASEAVTVPQLWAGYITLWISCDGDEDLDILTARLKGNGIAKLVQLPGGDKEVCCRCPWGNDFKVRRAPSGSTPSGCHPGGSSGLVAMPEVVHYIQKGKAQVLVKFWTKLMGCTALLKKGGEGGGPDECVVPFAASPGGPAGVDGGMGMYFHHQQVLRFVEDEAKALPLTSYDTDNDKRGYHAAFYMSSHAAFEAAFRAVDAAGLVYVNPRFVGGPPEFGSAEVFAVATACGQFRVKDLADPESGQIGLALELEVRSPRHKCFPLGTR
jgi:catechol 2,3-dioxygenase-like lactoylglutathione lyase family enzyme